LVNNKIQQEKRETKMKVLITDNGNFVINNLFVSPEGKVLREIENSELTYLETVCGEIELPEGFDLSEIERYETFSELLSQGIEATEKAREEFFTNLTSENERWRFSYLGSYEIRDLESSDFFSYFGGEEIEKTLVWQGKAKGSSDVIRIADFAEPPLFIIIQSMTEFRNEIEVVSQVILRCKKTFDKAIAKAKAIASETAQKELSQ